MTKIIENQTNKNIVTESFDTFFHGWLIRQENYLQELLRIDQIQSSEQNRNSQEIDEPKCKELTNRVMAHYGEYYETKSRIGSDNVFLLFSPTWLSSLELSFLWVAGFKPSLVFRLVNDSVLDLTKEQAQRMHVVMAETKKKEKELAKKLACIQEDVAAPPMMALVRRMGTGDKDSAVERLRLPMEELVGNADMLRSTTVGKVMEILSSAQVVKFLVAAAQLQLRIRALGIQRDVDQGGEFNL